MEITITKGAVADSLHIQRSDGTLVSTTFPHKGPIPHDAVHFFVESELGMQDGFWGLVATGSHPEEVGPMAKAAGHPSAARPGLPQAGIVSAIQAERIVECFEADLWGPGCDPQTFRETVSAGCEQSLVPAIPIDDEAIERVRRRLKEFRQHWMGLPLGHSCRLEWADG
ncbi:MAG: hypothetical protein ABR588_02660 [Sphingomicrobium sp.]|nr:hypothetical protein [Sphingomonadales bacterium]